MESKIKSESLNTRMLFRLKRLARQSLPLLVAYKIYDNWRLKRRFASGKIETLHGATHSKRLLSESLAYIEEQIQDYLRYSGLSVGQIQGKRILELGFGDNVGVALRFLAAGAARAVCIDKFYSKRDTAREREIYTALRQTLICEEQRRFDEVVDLTKGIHLNEKRIKCINGSSLEVMADKLLAEGECFDLIVSRAVIEEIYEPAQVLTAADRLLIPGGLMMHKVDLSDYGIFRDAGMHPLTFLTIPEAFYRRMASDSGIPNRKLAGYYRCKMSELGYDASFFITSIIGAGSLRPNQLCIDREADSTKEALALVEQIRPKLSRDYRDLSADELMIDGIFLVARKLIKSPCDG